KVCLRPCYHANGTVNMQVDEELKGRIHTEMMKAILRFEIRENVISRLFNRGKFVVK
ncbi:helix-turn-helix domain-containing protein, partial [[Clostridium] innocuum]|nr:helix-turn-helix domain-containing protein [[Clostridium] innocuum]